MLISMYTFLHVFIIVYIYAPIGTQSKYSMSELAVLSCKRQYYLVRMFSIYIIIIIKINSYVLKVFLL